MIVKPALLTCLTLLFAANLFAGAPQTASKPRPTIIVEASYPGANARVVADVVAAPIEHQVNGVEDLLHLTSRCTDDGKYLLAVTFKPGAELDKAAAAVQRRLALAEPGLPEEVKRTGITLKRRSPVQMIVSLTSPGGRFDMLYLSNYSTIQVRDELTRLVGVGEVAGFGHGDYNLRVWLDPEKLAARKLAPRDVVDAIRRENVQIPAGYIGKPPEGKKEFDLKVTIRPLNPEQFKDIIVQTDGKGAKVRLRDVAAVELGAAPTERCAILNGKPGVLLCVHPTGAANPKELSRAVADRIAVLGERAPKGLKLEVAFDFTANLDASQTAKATDEYLLLDLDLPDTVSMDRKRAVSEHCEKALKDVAGVQDVLALTESPFDIIQNQPCILVRLAPPDKRKSARDEMVQAIRATLRKVPDAAIRVRDLSRPGALAGCGYPIHLAVSGPEADKVRDLAQRLAQEMQSDKKLTDVRASRESEPRSYSHLVVDRLKAQELGVAMLDIFDTLQVWVGGVQVSDFNLFGRNWQVVVQVDERLRKRLDDLTNIKVRDKQGKLIPLSRVAAVETGRAPAAVVRLDQKPMVAITANLGAEATPAQARTVCETQFERLLRDSRLGAEYRLTWLEELPTPK